MECNNCKEEYGAHDMSGRLTIIKQPCKTCHQGHVDIECYDYSIISGICCNCDTKQELPVELLEMLNNQQ